MIILKETTDTQKLEIVLNNGKADTIILTEKDTDITTEIPCQFFANKYFSQALIVFPISEGNFYDFQLLYKGDEVHKGNIFCTNQDTTDYSINKDNYLIYD